MKKSVMIVIALILILGSIIFFIPKEKQEEQIIQKIISNDQQIINNAVVISEVISKGDGWIVIHVDNDGNPGKVIGRSSVHKGSNTNVIVDINSSEATPKLFVMLHIDEGEIGIYEFPGVDAPERHEDESIIVVPFNADLGKIPIEELPPEPLPTIKEFTIEADDAGLYPSSIEVNKGDNIKITFMVRSQGTYYGGLNFRSDVWGDTGKIAKGESTTLEFTAQKTFQFKSYWPASNQLKATGTVEVI